MSIEEICKKYDITNYTVNPDGSIDVHRSVDLSYNSLKEIPLNFNRVDGGFHICNNQLTSLKGCPKWIGGEIDLSCNLLTTLEGSPDHVGLNFWCDDNHLTSLKGCLKHIEGSFNCFSNQLTTLEYGPDYVGDSFDCNDNKLTSLKGCPKHVGKILTCNANKLTDIDFIPDYIGRGFKCLFNPLGSIFDVECIEFLRFFKSCRVINDNIINLKRLKYVMELFDSEINFKEIEKHYIIK